MKKGQLIYCITTQSIGFIIDIFEEGGYRTDCDGVRFGYELVEINDLNKLICFISAEAHVAPSIKPQINKFFSEQMF